MEDYGTVKLSRRERQIMDIVYQRGRASVADVLEDLPDPPTLLYSSSTVGNLGGEGVSHPPKRWQTLHLPPDATAPSGRTFRAQTDFSDIF